ncbi:NUDIX domain-containing protein [Flavobacterium sp. UGB4466]|uniref:NUDIX hydrolase n=1 Tax=Flavobacterium sp. UGB4466 TaxID=2730889 RepID=UPI00192C43AA|nr:NUDIX domain-containing protein [Flavobacterium sp. UGB4466]
MEKQMFFSVKALIIKNDTFLAVYNLVRGIKIWDLPGGRMEFGETAEETLKREIKEELNVEIRPVKVIDTWNYLPADNCQITGIIYYSELITNQIKISEEHDGYDWIAFDQAGTFFTKDFLLDQIQLWDWNSIKNDAVRFNKSIK